MDRLREMEVFVAVVEAGSFVGAATRLRTSPPAVTRAVASLEDRLGIRLLNRTTRALRLTDAGERFVEHARRLLDDIERAERDTLGEASAPAGHLTVTASATFGRMVLAPIVTAFLAEHPKVTASVRLHDRVVDLLDEGIDVAVRIAELPDSSLVARRVGEVRRLLVASPDYLAKHGTPDAPVQLREHAVIAFTGLMPGHEWRYQAEGRTRTVAITPRLEINDALSALAAAEAGEGITPALSYMISDAVAAGRMVPVLEDWAPAPAPVHLVHQQGRLVPPKIRAFMDFAAPRLAAALGDLSAGPD
ncbi:MAG: LysR family transcriptional regulator [Rhodospirillaceae bacterium]|jgi:DNA-binding transcriptional LysR family regulator|nr:LysR family transcriptional regulator [Rhodospirillaceae bacterium]MBT6537353.1 LysR family transcriptional regulator [Rhodospirillaceae bacterium]MBT7361756.1 LysR family transcriptional regulator [Rhodospirillaceae bacterium]